MSAKIAVITPKFPEFGYKHGPAFAFVGFGIYYNVHTRLVCWTTPFAHTGMISFNPSIRWAGSRFWVSPRP